LNNVGIPVIKHDVKYDEDEKEVQLGVGWKSFFKNNDETVCPITSCSLKAPGCKSSYKGNQLKMNETAPWVIYTKVDDIKSDEVSACIQCSHED